MPRTRRARDKQIDGFRRVTRNMRGGNDIIGGAPLMGKDGKAISIGNTVTCSGLFGSKTFTVQSIDAAKKLVNPGKYAAAKCTKADPNAIVKDTMKRALKVNDEVKCKGLFGSSTFKIARIEGATGKVFDAKKNGYVAATKCTYQAPLGAVSKKRDGKRSAIRVQIKEADIKTYKINIESVTGSTLLGYTKKDGSLPVQLGGNMNPDGTMEEEGGALKRVTTLSTFILIFKDTINPIEFEKQAAKDATLKSRINVDTTTTPVPGSYAQLISAPSSSGRETAVRIQIKSEKLRDKNTRTLIEKAAGFKILGFTDKSGKNPQQLGGSLNPDGTFEEEGGALKTVTTLSTFIVIFNGPVNAIAFESKVASTPALKAIMNVDNKTTPVPASFQDVRAGPGASGTQTAIKIQIKSENLRANKAGIEAAAGHKILGFTNSKGAKPEQLGGSLNPDGTFEEEGGALSRITILPTNIVVFNGAVNVTAFASKVASNPALKKIMNVDDKTTPVPASFTQLLSAPPPSNTPSNSGSSAISEEEAAAVEAAASADTAAEAAAAVASTTSNPTLQAAAERAAAKPGATPASVQKAVQAAAEAAPAAIQVRAAGDTETAAACLLPSGKTGTQPSWEPDQDYPNPVSVIPAQVPPSMNVNITGISLMNIKPTRTKIGTMTLFYTFVLIKGKVFGITAAASSEQKAMELMQAKMNKESGVVKLGAVSDSVRRVLAIEAAEDAENHINSLEGTIDTLLGSPAADSATARAIQQQVATHKKTIVALKISLGEHNKAAQSGGRRKSRRHSRKKAGVSRRR